MNISKKVFQLILAALFPFIILSCAEKNEAGKVDTGKAEQKADRSLKVATTRVETRVVQRKVDIVGTLAAWEEVSVNSISQGTVEKIFADLGDTVGEGQTLLKFDDREALSNLAAQEANLKTNERALERANALRQEAETNLKRYNSLFAEGMVSRKDMDTVQTQYAVQEALLKQAEAQVNYARALVDIARKNLQDTTILSPINGEVRKRLVSKGEVVREKTPLFVLVKNDPLKLKTSATEQFVKDIKIGQDVVIYVEVFPETGFGGKVERISPSVDEKTRSMEVEIRIPNPKRLLKSGLFAKGHILTRKDKDVPFVHESAVYSFVGVNKVYVVKDNKVQDRHVKTGIRESGFVEIIEGIKPGDVVATSNLDQLFEGARIQE
ncbi:MAG: hypothetical protein A2073_06890 [Deltaproteobacteria bacterium GWC2_42_11]|nr:MAG: hypothetical protein A2073_06890 [Deltaproteobacteria bacterium GWC2_42_11]HBO85200.1 hypothetical protein [Deltaproteobacteria bacterium]